jgi:exoribonuclease-2
MAAYRDLAAQHGSHLPDDPDAVALEEWLLRQRAEDPQHFPDLSLSVIKLLGRGEYVVEEPGEAATGHFGLAVQDYTHSTAPNRRFPDLVAQRIVKSALQSRKPPYTDGELESIAQRCTEREDAANKVERLVRKAAAALLLQNRVRRAIRCDVTGASEKGTWVRIRRPPVEGRLERGWEGLEVGDRVRVKLVHTDRHADSSISSEDNLPALCYGPVVSIHLVNPSHVSFGIGVITPRWLYVLAAATPERYGRP